MIFELPINHSRANVSIHLEPIGGGSGGGGCGVGYLDVVECITPQPGQSLQLFRREAFFTFPRACDGRHCVF